MKNTILFLLTILSFTLHAQFRNPDIRVLTLENGLTIILNPDATQNKVFGGVAVRAGSKNDPSDLTGIAHYLEHMLFKGTDELGTTDYETERNYLERISVMYEELRETTDEETKSLLIRKINESSLEAGRYAIPTEFDKLIRSIGGSGLNAFTSDEITFFFNAFPSHQIEKWLDIYSHRFTNPVFRLFQSELEVVYEEKNMYNDNFTTALFETFLAHLYKNHPYGQQTTIGTTEHLKKPSLRRMYEFYRTYYVANNMGLVLAGNFNVERVIPIINEKFGALRSDRVPRFPVFEEVPFNGREFVSVRLSPVKIGALGFRTVPNNHADEFVLDVCEKLLSNNAQTGLLDRLAIDNKLMFAGILPFGRNNDHGSSVILFIPKIVGQSLNKAEKLIMNELDRLRRGDFDDALFEAVKNELYTDYISSFENLESRTVLLAQAFSQYKDIRDIMNYPEKIRAVTKQDVLRAANLYYGSNYLALHSKMGFPKKEKLEKPGFDPIIPTEGTVSPYAQRFYEMKVESPVLEISTFEESMQQMEIHNKIQLYYVPNPLNDIFTFKYKIGIGSYYKPLLPYAAQILNYAGAGDKNVSELKAAFHQIGITYGISCDESYLSIEMEGMEANFEKGLALLNQLLTNPKVDKEKLKIIINEEKTVRKMEDKEPADVARALVQYIRKGENSYYLKRFSLKEIKKLKIDKLLEEFADALTYAGEVHYTGSMNPAEKVANLVRDVISFNSNLKDSKAPVYIADNTISENIVYFINDKKAIQSQIYFLANGNEFNIDEAAYYDAFNEYFGGGFSGLVVQEIREYRSMAYATGASLQTPDLGQKPAYFVGFIGTQADKTKEALDIFMGLFRNMPLKEERFEVLKTSLIEELFTGKPNFRVLSETILSWQQQGFDSDPAKYKNPRFLEMTFQDINNFYVRNLKNKPVAICIVGDKERLDMEHIATFGRIVELNKNVLFRK
ncbi:MAG: insulinase family protein [Bacteroidales bacterium]|nr:insulinase family protein [Bacteroidales bacterium]